jgi:hypothetical protein
MSTTSSERCRFLSSPDQARLEISLASSLPRRGTPALVPEPNKNNLKITRKFVVAQSNKEQS